MEWEGVREGVNIKEMWHFWNKCFLGREYPRRKIKKMERGIFRDYICQICKKKCSGHRYLSNSVHKYICPGCYNKKKQKEMEKAISDREKEAIDNASKFKDLLKDCTKLGTCDILAAHHELLVNDDDRLKTDFIMKQLKLAKENIKIDE
jgi:hypothetical protein